MKRIIRTLYTIGTLALVVACAAGSWAITARGASTREDNSLRPVRAQAKALALSPDGHTLATVNKKNQVELWNWKTGRQLTRLVGSVAAKQARMRVELAFAPDGRHLAAASPSAVCLWDIQSPDRVKMLPRAMGIPFVAFSADSKLLACNGISAQGSGAVYVWDIAANKMKQRLEIDKAAVAAFAPDGKSLAVGQDSGGFFCWVRLFNLETGKFTTPDMQYAFSGPLAFSADGKHLYCSYLNFLFVDVDLSTGKMTEPFKKGRMRMTVVAFAAGAGKMAAVIGDRCVVVDLATMKPTAELPSLVKRNRGVAQLEGPAALSADGKVLAVIDQEGTVKFVAVS
jgi:WD40 repeat protein